MEDEIIAEMAQASAEWTDDQLASKMVELLIRDKGVINAWERTAKMMVKIIRKREQILLAQTA